MVLDLEQSKAAGFFEGPLLLLAGPGSGKTTVLTARVYNLIKSFKVQPQSILVLTFTKEAALSMQKKFIRIARGEILGYNDVTFGTFHSVFLKILTSDMRYKDAEIIAGQRRIEILKEAARVTNVKADFSAEFFDRLSGDISRFKNTSRLDFELSSGFTNEDFLTVFHEYEEKKARLLKIDFDDMLTLTKKLFIEKPETLLKIKKRYQFLLIDEAQDMNALQFDIMRLVAGEKKNIFLVGDDDQSIYGFRGAEPKFMLSFKDYYPDGTIMYLNSNYRCPEKVVTKSLNLISHNKKRFQKNLISRSNVFGDVSYHIHCDELKEAEFAYSEIKASIENNEKVAVLVRHRIDGETLLSVLNREGIKYNSLIGGKLNEEPFFIEDILSYFRISEGDFSRENILRVINKPGRDIPRTGIEDEFVNPNKWLSYFERDISIRNSIIDFLSEVKFLSSLGPMAAYSYIMKSMGYERYLNDFLRKNASVRPCFEKELKSFCDELRKYKRISIFLQEYEEIRKLRYSKENNKIKKDTGVYLYTFHGSKGLEFDKVIILSVNDGIVPSNKALTERDKEEERRMFYVAVTRAKKRLLISCVKKRGSKELNPSIYIKEMEKGIDI